ncbi:hypothetical protein J6590_029921 [Homalodisca vitripennis]|nr:hypothetical protein J6590_029921 [Homalodisca vitripennis]
MSTASAPATTAYIWRRLHPRLRRSIIALSTIACRPIVTQGNVKLDHPQRYSVVGGQFHT